MLRNAIALALFVAFSAHAQSAEAEVEQQLKEMVGNPPTKLLVEFEGLDQPNMKLEEVAFELDGSALPVPAIESLNGDGKHLIFHGDIKPGKHTLETTVVFTDTSSFIMSAESGFKWKVKNTRSFEQAPGLEVQILVTPELNPGERDVKKKLALRSTATPKMLAKLEDGAMPPPPKPNVVLKEEPDAGAAVAALTPAEKAKQAKLAAAEERKRKKEEAAAARAAAAEEKKRKREEALAAAREAADEKKRQKEEAVAAAKAAAEEKKHAKEEAVAAAKAAAEEKKHPSDETAAAKQPGTAEAKPGETVALTGNEAKPGEPTQGEAKPPEPEAVPDAGPAVAARAEPRPTATSPAPEPASSGGLPVPLPVMIGLGVALLGVIIFFATRKKAPPPY